MVLLTFWPFAGEAQQGPPPSAKADNIDALREKMLELQTQLKQIQTVLGDVAAREARQPEAAKAADGDPERWRDAQKAYEDGSRAEDQHQFAVAIGHFTRALQLDPANDSAFLHRGACYFELGNFERALGDLSDSLRLQPNNSRSYQLRADAYFAAGKYVEAISDLDQAIRRNQQNVATYAQRAKAYQSLGQPDRALEDCRKAVTLAPRFERGLICRAMALIALGREQEAMPDLKAVLEMNPESNEARTLIAQAGERPASNRTSGMVASVQPAPATAPVPVKRAAVPSRPALAQADMHEADRMVIRAVTNALKPVLMPARRVTPEQRRQADAIVAKARIRLNRGEYRNSLDMLDQAIQLDPQSALAYNSRGYAHLRLKEYQLAIDDFTVAINLRNGYTNAMHNLEVARKLGGFRNSRPEQLIAVSSDAEDPDFGGPDHE